MPPITRIPLLALLAAAAASSAQAETSPYFIGASQAFSHSTNLLRLSDGQAVPDGFSKSDTVSATSLLAGLDQPFGRQRVYGNLALRANRLANNKVYDNESYALTAGLDWATVERISGSLRATANRNLASFNADEIGFVQKKNLETTQQVDAAFRVGVVTELTAELNVGGRSLDYSADEFQSREFRQNSASIGLRWRPGGAGTLGLALRETKGRYPKAFPAGAAVESDRFDSRDVDFSASVEASAASTLSARISLGKTSYDVATQRGYSGVTGLLRWEWQPTGKLRLNTQLTRDPSQASYFFSSAVPNSTVENSRLATTLRLRTDYEASAKIALNSTLSYGRRSLVRTLPAAAGGTELTGNDRSSGLGFGASWTPVRSLQFGCDLAQERRSSDSTLSSNFSDTTVSCFGQVTLQ
jgi:hypothetical protein